MINISTSSDFQLKVVQEKIFKTTYFKIASIKVSFCIMLSVYWQKQYNTQKSIIASISWKWSNCLQTKTIYIFLFYFIFFFQVKQAKYLSSNWYPINWNYIFCHLNVLVPPTFLYYHKFQWETNFCPIRHILNMVRSLPE